MAQHALLDVRPGSARGFTLMVLMLIATLVAIGAIALAAAHSVQSPGGTSDAQPLGQLLGQSAKSE